MAERMTDERLEQIRAYIAGRGVKDWTDRLLEDCVAEIDRLTKVVVDGMISLGQIIVSHRLDAGAAGEKAAKRYHDDLVGARQEERKRCAEVLLKRFQTCQESAKRAHDDCEYKTESELRDTSYTIYKDSVVIRKLPDTEPEQPGTPS